MIWLWILLAVVLDILLIVAVAVGVFFGTLYLQYYMFEHDWFKKRPMGFWKWFKCQFDRKKYLEEIEKEESLT